MWLVTMHLWELRSTIGVHICIYIVRSTSVYGEPVRLHTYLHLLLRQTAGHIPAFPVATRLLPSRYLRG